MNTINKALKSLTIVDENILEIEYNDHVHIDLMAINDLFKALYDFTKDKPLKRLVIIAPGTTVDKEARKVIQEENYAKRTTIIAEAVLVHTLTHKMMFNIYAKFIKSIYPTRFFTDIHEARLWLKEQN